MWLFRFLASSGEGVQYGLTYFAFHSLAGGGDTGGTGYFGLQPRYAYGTFEGKRKSFHCGVCYGLSLALAGDAVLAGFNLPFDTFDSTVVRGSMVNLLPAIIGLTVRCRCAFYQISITLIVTFLGFFLFGEAGAEVHHLFFVVL